MKPTDWIVAISAFLTALATIAIAIYALITFVAMRRTEKERNDLYRALVVSNPLDSQYGFAARERHR